jgi:RNA polymerase sigma factor (TIGR02999 family)
MIVPVDGTEEDSVTQLLADWRAGDDRALERVVPLIYNELRRLARTYLQSQPQGHTLRPTALVHEFYLRTGGMRNVQWESRGQFIAAAAKAMRNLLVDHARKRTAQKRGGDCRADFLDEVELSSPELDLDVIEVHRALDKPSGEFPRHAEVVELMFFGGLNAAEASDVMKARGISVSPRTVERDWRFARAWLSREIQVH